MSIAVCDLRLKESYTSAVPFDMEAFRIALRETREAWGGRDKLAEKIGRAPSTIQSAELGPDMPGIDTVAAIIEGSNSTLWEFFAKLDGVQNWAERSHESVDNPPSDAPPVQDSSAQAHALLVETITRIHDALATALSAPGATKAADRSATGTAGE